MPNPETVECMVCEGGCDPIPLDEFESIGPLYVCECGEQFTRETSDNGNHQCPQCNKFAAREADEGCPSCNAAAIEQATRYRCPKCKELYETEKDAGDCCSREGLMRKKERQEAIAERDRKWAEKEAAEWAAAPEIADIRELLTMIPLPKMVRHEDRVYIRSGGTMYGLERLFGEERPVMECRYYFDRFAEGAEDCPPEKSGFVIYAGRCADNAVRLVHVRYGHRFDDAGEAEARAFLDA